MTSFVKSNFRPVEKSFVGLIVLVILAADIALVSAVRGPDFTLTPWLLFASTTLKVVLLSRPAGQVQASAGLQGRAAVASH